jgi:RnfABCDGE-type electron transport complex B subunit
VFNKVQNHVAFIDESFCIGCTFCLEACPVDSIVGAPKRLHTVVSATCTNCGACAAVCPMECITFVPTALPEPDALTTKVRTEAHLKRFSKSESAEEPPVDFSALQAALERSRKKRQIQGWV